MIFRALKRLESVISLSIVSPQMNSGSWDFAEFPGVIADSVNGKQTMPEVYLAADPRFTGRVTVPVLWDKERATIVNNELSEIIRMLNSAFDAFTEVKTDYYPAALRAEIDEINAFVYANVNNGVYRAGFARTQDAYEEAFRDVFGALDTLEERLSRQRYLVGKADHRGRLAAVRHAGALRCRLLRAVQVQSAPAERLSEPVELPARSLFRAGRRRDGRPRAHQARLLPQAAGPQPERRRAARAGARFLRAA